MKKMNGKSKDLVSENIQMWKSLFPETFTEGKLDVNALKEVLGTFVDDRDERYSFTWNGKSKARMIAQTPSTGTLRPCKEESVDWDSTQNIFIEGDNLEVLKLLQKSYHKKVKMIYIDPPYNTGKDFVYKDNFKDNIKNYKEITGQVDGEGRNLSNNPETSGRYHTDWLNMMYPRLKLARNLLKDDGVIFISIDDNEVSNLRKMCDEIFGEENFLGTLTRKQSSGSKNDTGSNKIVTTTDQILSYSKAEFRFYPLLVKPNKKYRYADDKGSFDIRALEMQGGDDTLPLREKMGFSIYFNNSTNDLKIEFDYDLNQSKVYDEPNSELIKNGYACYRPRKRGNQFGIWRWGKETFLQRFEEGNVYFDDSRVYLKEREVEFIEKYPDSLLVDFLNTQGTNEVKEIFRGQKYFTFPKPINLLKYLLNLSSRNDDLVLDFFAGSATTAHAVMQLNAEDGGKRKFIMVQLPETTDEKSEAYKAGYKTIAEISKERIRRAAAKIKEENPEYNGDLGFKVFKLDSTNIKPWEVDFDMTERTLEDYISNIKTDRREEDVLYEILLKYGLDLTLPITEHAIAGQKVFNIGMGALIICLSDAISLDVVEGIAKLKDELNPEIMRVVFKDSGFEDDVVKTNAVQILKQDGVNDVRSL